VSKKGQGKEVVETTAKFIADIHFEVKRDRDETPTRVWQIVVGL